MSDGLSTEDKITLCIIRNYLDFKVSVTPLAKALTLPSSQCDTLLVVWFNEVMSGYEFHYLLSQNHNHQVQDALYKHAVTAIR